MTPEDRGELAKAYADVFSMERPSVVLVMDDFSALAGARPSMTVSEVMARIYSMRSWTRRANRRKGA